MPVLEGAVSMWFLDPFAIPISCGVLGFQHTSSPDLSPDRVPKIRRLPIPHHWRLLAGITVPVSTIALIGVEWWTGRVPVAVYLLPVSLAGLAFEVWGGVGVGIAISLLRILLRGADGEQLLWLFGNSFAGGLVGLLSFQSRKLAEANRELIQHKALQDSLTDFLVHDLRSPLTSIIGGLQTLVMVAGNRLSDDAREIIDLSLVGSQRMLTLVNSLLDLKKLEDGKFPLYVREFHPEDAIREAINQVSLWARQNQISVTVRLDQTLTTIRADRWLLIRVLVNLLSNAIKYTPSGGTITVTGHREDSQLRISVTDQGPGIPPDYLDKVFDKFSQIEARKGGAAVGTGLGLTFCKLAVEAHSGRIWLESAVGKGTTVHLALPLPPPRVATSKPAEA